MRVYVIDPAEGKPRFVDCLEPRALESDEVVRVVHDYRKAAALALEAGFDGVEIHGANGYLVDQFLRSTTNLRTDRYGGSPGARVTFLHEVVRASAAEVGSDRTGVRISPHVTLQDMADPEMVPTSLLVAEMLAAEGVAYLHFAEADWDDAREIPLDYRTEVRERFPGPIIVAGRYTPQRGAALLEAGLADLVAFGRPFLANPDYPERVWRRLPLNAPDPATFFGGAAEGYDDYPRAAAEAAE